MFSCPSWLLLVKNSMKRFSLGRDQFSICFWFIIGVPSCLLEQLFFFWSPSLSLSTHPIASFPAQWGRSDSFGIIHRTLRKLIWTWSSWKCSQVCFTFQRVSLWVILFESLAIKSWNTPSAKHPSLNPKNVSALNSDLKITSLSFIRDLRVLYLLDAIPLLQVKNSRDFMQTSS